MDSAEVRPYIQAIKRCTDCLCRNFQVDCSYPLFISKLLLSFDDVENIKAERTQLQRTEKLLNILLTKDPKLAFETIYYYVTDRCYQPSLGAELRNTLKSEKASQNNLDCNTIREPVQVTEFDSTRSCTSVQETNTTETNEENLESSWLNVDYLRNNPNVRVESNFTGTSDQHSYYGSTLSLSSAYTNTTDIAELRSKNSISSTASSFPYFNLSFNPTSSSDLNRTTCNNIPCNSNVLLANDFNVNSTSTPNPSSWNSKSDSVSMISTFSYLNSNPNSINSLNSSIININNNDGVETVTNPSKTQTISDSISVLSINDSKSPKTTKSSSTDE